MTSEDASQHQIYPIMGLKKAKKTVFEFKNHFAAEPSDKIIEFIKDYDHIKSWPARGSTVVEKEDLEWQNSALKLNVSTPKLLRARNQSSNTYSGLSISNVES